MGVGRLGFSGRNGGKQFLSNVYAVYYLITRRKNFLQLDFHVTLTTLRGKRKTFPNLKQLSLKENGNGFILVFKTARQNTLCVSKCLICQ